MSTTLHFWRQRFNNRLGTLYSERECRQMLRMALEAFGSQTEVQLLLDSEGLNTDTADQLDQFLDRAALGEPIQYILGHTIFDGLKIQVAPGVLIPRPETEELVQWIKESYTKESPKKIIDLGTGSGCILLALAKHFPKASCMGIDVSTVALEIAAKNANFLNVNNVQWFNRDLLNPDVLQQERYDLMVSNPPYIAPIESSSLNQNVLKYEPHLALFTPKDDPLLFYRHIAAFSGTHLNPGASIFLEMHEDYAHEVQALFAEIPGTSTELRLDLQGKKRMLRVLIH